MSDNITGKKRKRDDDDDGLSDGRPKKKKVKLLDYVRCPITHMIYCDPVTAADGQTYEREAIVKWLDEKHTSPISRKRMSSKDIHPNIAIKNIVSDLIDDHPEYKDQMYESNKSYTINKKKIWKYIWSKNFRQLLNYNEYMITDFIQFGVDGWSSNESLFSFLIKNCKDNVIIAHVINNSIDIDCANRHGKKPIYYICRHGNVDMLKLILEKGVDLNYTDRLGRKLIHYICHYGNIDMLKLIMEKNIYVNLNCKNLYGRRPIHYICRYGNIDMLKLIIEKVDLNCRDNEGERPVHYACQYNNVDMLKLLMEKDVYLNRRNNKGIRPIHYSCQYMSNDGIKLLVDANIMLVEKNDKVNSLEYLFNRKDYNTIYNILHLYYIKLVTKPRHVSDYKILYRNSNNILKLVNIIHNHETIKKKTELIYIILHVHYLIMNDRTKICKDNMNNVMNRLHRLIEIK